MPVPAFVVDAFAEGPFSGNPAGVCLLDEPRPRSWMQAIAKEFNQAETAFVSITSDVLAIRWFSPATEIALCGHATLATAHVLWQSGLRPCHQTLRFHYDDGELAAALNGDRIELDFPTVPECACDPTVDFTALIGATAGYVGRSALDFIVTVADEPTLRNLAPDLPAIARLPARGLIVTARAAEPGFDFVSRFFAPAVGINEDPVTGSAHCTLGRFWQERLGKGQLRARQLSPRGGVLDVTVAGARTRLAGRAFTVFRGELLL